jgi:hypothetical protein
MKRLLLLLAVLAVPAVPTPAHAQTETPRQPASTLASGDCARARQAGRTCSLVFDTAEEIDGKRIGNDLDTFTGRSPLSFTSLISVRESFRDRIIHAAEDL